MLQYLSVVASNRPPSLCSSRADWPAGRCKWSQTLGLSVAASPWLLPLCSPHAAWPAGRVEETHEELPLYGIHPSKGETCKLELHFPLLGFRRTVVFALHARYMLSETNLCRDAYDLECDAHGNAGVPSSHAGPHRQFGRCQAYQQSLQRLLHFLRCCATRLLKTCTENVSCVSRTCKAYACGTSSAPPLTVAGHIEKLTPLHPVLHHHIQSLVKLKT
eukprot:scaffold119806_cov24-Tisochrysis_lutea.AAC.1